MPLQVVCSACNTKLKAPDTAAGKKTKCPKCQAVISVPVDAPQSPAASTIIKKTENWHMQTTDGSQFGPVPKSELDEWFKEGRISSDCQLLKEGSDQWQWASEIYPSLEQAAPSAPANKPGFDFLGPATPKDNDPLGLGNAGVAAAPLPAAPSLSAPSFGGAPAPSFGGGYGGSFASTNPYSSPSVSSYSRYGSQPRSGLHPMVIISSIIQFLGGGLNLLFSLFILGFMVMVLVSGAGIASSMPQNAENAEAAGAMVALATGLGVLCMLPVLLVALGLGTLKIFTGMALLKKKFWAKIVSIILAILYVLLYGFGFLLNLVALFGGHQPLALIYIGLDVLGIALNAVILTAMFIPDCTNDFA